MAANLQPYSLFSPPGYILPTDLTACTPTQDTAHVQFGAQALKITPSAVTWGCGTGVTNVGMWSTVSAATVYSMSAYVWTSLASMLVGIGVDWYTSANAYISSTAFTGVAVTQNVFTRISAINQTSPAGAAFASMGWVSKSTWTVSSALWVSAAKMEQAAAITVWSPGPTDPWPARHAGRRRF